MRETQPARVSQRALAGVLAGALAWTALAAPAAADPPDPAETTTALTSGLNPSLAGQAVTFTATVTGATPTGTVVLREGEDELASTELVEGVATFVLTPVVVGDHALVASYAGDEDDAASDSEALTQTVAGVPVPPLPPLPPVPPVVPAAPAPVAPVVKKPQVRLNASATQVSVGDKVTLRWRSKGAEAARASGAWGGTQERAGRAVVRITDRGRNVFKMTVQNAAGKASAKAVVVATRKAKELALVVTDELVVAGSEVAVVADGLAAGETYTVRLDGKPVLSGNATKKGDVRGSFTVRKDAADGVRTLTITGSNPGRVGTATLSVIRPKALEVEVAEDELLAGAEQTVTVSGLLPGEEVTVRYMGKEISAAVADDAGHYTFGFPVGMRKGERTVVVTGALPTRTGEAEFSVTKDDASGPEV